MERKRLISLVGGLCLTVIGTVGGKAQEVYITVENKSTEDVFLQPEDTTGYRKETGRGRCLLLSLCGCQFQFLLFIRGTGRHVGITV